MKKILAAFFLFAIIGMQVQAGESTPAQQTEIVMKHVGQQMTLEAEVMSKLRTAVNDHMSAIAQFEGSRDGSNDVKVNSAIENLEKETADKLRTLLGENYTKFSELYEQSKDWTAADLKSHYGR